MVMAMDSYYAQDRLQEIWKKINTLHLSYLEMEESPQKLEQRNKLEECIKEYLCLAPHNQKFCLQETAEVLNMSAMNMKDFSGYRASLGWQAIGMYAGNLLSQPWRKEYREIKMYSGFYVHQIDANLMGAEIMFEVMGYKHIGNGILVLDGPICPDRVTQVSQDSLVAYMECQILKAIWEEVSKTYKVSWLEVLQYRESHLCSPKQSVQALNYKYHQRQFHEHNRSYSQGAEPYQQRYSSTLPHVIPTNMSFPPLSSHAHMPVQPPLPPPQYLYGTNGCYAPAGYAQFPPVVAPQPYQYSPVALPQYQQPPMKPNNYYYTNGYATLPQPTYAPIIPPIPTGNLIDIEPVLPPTYDAIDGPSNSQKIYDTCDIHRNKEEDMKNSNNSHTDKEEGSGTFESWDYVYKNLESQGYYKDLGERGDILSPPLGKDRKHVREAKKVRSIDLEDAMQNLSLHRPLRVDNKRKEEQRHYDLTQSSSYDNLSVHEPVAPKITSSKTLPRDRLVVSDKPEYSKAGHSKTLDSRKVKRSTEEKPKAEPKVVPVDKAEPSTSKWQCKACTFLNATNSKVCEMCGKSQNNIAQDMEVGGAQCSMCTLVNRKDLKECEACGHSLKGSPTYI